MVFRGGNLGVIHPQQITAKIDVNVYDNDINSVYYIDYVSDGNFFSEDFTSYEEYESIYGWISHCNFLIEIKINDLSVFANAEKIEIIFSLESTTGLYDTPLVSVIPVERENNKRKLGVMSKFDYLIN